MKRKAPILMTLTVGLLFLQGCTTYGVKDPLPVSQVPSVSEIDPEYLIQVGDTVRVSIRTAGNPLDPDITEVPVRPDGKVFFPLLDDEVLLAGYTPSKVRDVLTKHYSELIRDPMITVNITAFGDRAIYVAGEVRDIRERFPFSRGMTAMRAIAAVGHDTYRADLNNVILVRQRGNGEQPMVVKLELKEALTNRDTTQDVALMPNDIVFVPPRGMVEAGDAIRDINALVPLPGFVYPASVLEYADARDL